MAYKRRRYSTSKTAGDKWIMGRGYRRYQHRWRKKLRKTQYGFVQDPRRSAPKR